MNPTEGVISEAFDLYKKHFGHLFVTALVVYLAIAILSVLFILIGGWVGALLSAILSVIGVFLVQAALVEAVADIRDGRADLTVGETLSRGASRIGSVAGASILAGIAIAIGLVLLIVPGLVLITWWAVLVPVIVLERVGVFDAFSRSRNLVRGFDFQVFGVIVLQFLILVAVSIVISIILVALPEEPRAFVSNVVSGSLTGPFAALVTTLLFFRLKAAKEGPGTTPAPGTPPPAVP
ncbi:MAG: hypothetical protein ACRDJT_05275 [Actinomycetota bacterium]